MRVYSHSDWLVIFVQPIAAECWRGRGGKLSRILGKIKQYLMNSCTYCILDNNYSLTFGKGCVLQRVHKKKECSKGEYLEAIFHGIEYENTDTAGVTTVPLSSWTGSVQVCTTVPFSSLTTSDILTASFQLISNTVNILLSDERTLKLTFYKPQEVCI